MKRKSFFITILTTTVTVCSLSADAGLVERANANFSWTFDSQTDLDWLDFDGGAAPSTVGRSYNTIVSELGPGGEYEGWRYATREEIATFIFNITGIANTLGGYLMAYDGITDQVAVFTGYTLARDGVEHINGFTGDEDPNAVDPDGVGWQWVVSLFDGNEFRSIGFDAYTLDVETRPRNGVSLLTGSWLTRTAVAIPEPKPMSLISFGLVLLVFKRRVRNRLATGTALLRQGSG